MNITLASALVIVGLSGCCVALAGSSEFIHEPYHLDHGLRSRSISFENPTGEPGTGGQASSNLGVGRKGAPARTIKPGETVLLCDIQGPGTIRHI
jgi:hypothetical protein